MRKIVDLKLKTVMKNSEVENDTEKLSYKVAKVLKNQDKMAPMLIDQLHLDGDED